MFRKKAKGHQEFIAREAGKAQERTGAMVWMLLR